MNVKQFIAQQATTDARDCWGHAPLDDAIRHDHKEVVDRLRCGDTNDGTNN